MLKISKKVEYALMALKFISNKQDNELTTTREICERFSIPFDTTAKVLQSLNQYGVVKSLKGIKGGYALEKDLNSLSYMDVTRIVEQRDNSNICMSNKGLCELYTSCNIVDPVDKLNRTLNEYLERLTISQLFELSFPETNRLNKNNNDLKKVKKI